MTLLRKSPPRWLKQKSVAFHFKIEIKINFFLLTKIFQLIFRQTLTAPTLITSNRQINKIFLPTINMSDLLSLVLFVLSQFFPSILGHVIILVESDLKIGEPIKNDSLGFRERFDCTFIKLAY